MKITRNNLVKACLLVLATVAVNSASAVDLEAIALNPAEETKPWCYWYWLNNDLTAEGITKDLESMASVGIKKAMIGHIYMESDEKGAVHMLSPEWYALKKHAFREAARVGVQLYIFNSPGWSQSGGPWVKPEQSMRRVEWQEFETAGGDFSRKVRPAGVPNASQDIAVLAVPRKGVVSVTGVSAGEKKNRQSFCFEQEVPVRGLLVYGKAKGTLYVLRNGAREKIAESNAGGGRTRTDFLPGGVETFSFKEVLAREFEFVGESGSRMVLTSAPTVAQVVEKQIGRMHPTPRPTWESYLFPDSVEPDDAAAAISRNEILDLSDQLGADGVLSCTLPEGDWTVIAFGMVTTGAKNKPASPEATGLEVDKMNREHTQAHFEAYVGELMKRMSPEEREAFRGVTIDSYEVGAQNWTDGFAAEFEKRNGYNPICLLPVFTGRVVDSAKTSDQFLWDLRRTVADMIAENYVGGLREIANRNGLVVWCENYGHWGFPGEFLIYGGYSDQISGEFWTRKNGLGSTECRAASSAAHIYGKPRVFAEAFTGRMDPESHPYLFKARGDEMFCEGINHFVLHVYVHQPRTGVPGRNPWFGTPFHRNTPWFVESRDWVKYLQRCHTLLQQGRPSAEVLVYIGDFAPQMTGPRNPVPAGYDFDYVGSDAILRTLDVKDGEWVVYDENNSERISARWSVLAMPELKYIRPKVQARLDALEKKGGRIVQGVPIRKPVLRELGIFPATSAPSFGVLSKVRELDGGGMLFFLSNFNSTGSFEMTFRVKGKAPELFNPMTGQITRIARYEETENGTKIQISVADRADSYFVIFRDPQAGPSVVSVSAPVTELDLSYNAKHELVAKSAKAGNYTLTLSDGTTERVEIPGTAAPIVIDGPWDTENHDEEGFSVIHKTTFHQPFSFGENDCFYLDLGKVEVMAKVTLNGKTYETLWMPPFTLDVTEALKAGRNELSVLVTSPSAGLPKLGDLVQLTHKKKTVIRP